MHAHLDEDDTLFAHPQMNAAATANSGVFKRARDGQNDAASAAVDIDDADAAVLEPPPQLPTDTKGYYACRRCRRVLVEMQWYKEGCLGCGTGPIHRGELAEYASSHFSNFFGLIDPKRSWVARLIGKGGRGVECPNAIYAEAITDEDEDEEEEEFDEDMDDGDDAEHPLKDGAAPGALANRMDGDELFGF